MTAIEESDVTHGHDVSIPIGRVARALAVLVAALTIATFCAAVMKWREVGGRVARFIDADQKVNFPTGYKILALVSSAVLVGVIAHAANQRRDPRRRRWLAFASVIAFLSLDEIASIHQSFGNYVRDHAHTKGALHFAWVIVWGPLALAAAAYLWPLVADLPSRIRRDLLIAGVLFGGGSAISALLKGEVVASSGRESARFYLVAAASDTIEMIGLAILVVAALRLMAATLGEVRIRPHDESTESEHGLTSVRSQGGSRLHS